MLTTDPGTESGSIQVLSSEQLSRGDALTKEAAIQGILVRLRQFRILILPSVNEASLAGLKCDHADVVYCGRLRGRRFPRDLLISKLKPAVLIVNGTKAEITATSQHDASGPKYFYLKQDGAVTTALLNEGLIVQGYRGSEFRLRNRSR
jgi:hypothetical protein